MLEQLGGKFGRVYKARDKRTGKLVALKRTPRMVKFDKISRIAPSHRPT